MKVGMYYNNRDVRVEELAVPEVGEGDVLMEVQASGICGSDIMEWYRIKKAPLVLGHEVILLEDCIGDKVETAVQALVPGDVALLENLRCHPGETANDAEFACRLASLADLYVDDAFGAVHRAHASIIGVPPLVEVAAAGHLLELEVQMLSRCLDEPAKPFVLVAGGAKVSDKLDAGSVGYIVTNIKANPTSVSWFTFFRHFCGKNLRE